MKLSTAHPQHSSRFHRWLAEFKLERNWPLYVMILLPIIFVLVFNYVPLYGLLMAFQDFNPAKGILGSEFVGLKWFRMAMNMPDFGNIVSNTVSIAVGKIVFGQLMALLFALLLNEVRTPSYKKTIQTITYFPHFLSWVIIGGIFTDLLTSQGLINKFIGLFGAGPIFFLGDNRYFQGTMIALDVWKEFGYNAIMYLAAMTAINLELYDAATIDGAGRLQQAFRITIPSIRTTILMLAVLSLGGIFNAGFEQILVMYNPAVYETGDILDTFIYRQGLLDAQYSLSTAIGLFKSVISLTLMLITNRIATKHFDYRIF